MGGSSGRGVRRHGKGGTTRSKRPGVPLTSGDVEEWAKGEVKTCTSQLKKIERSIDSATTAICKGEPSDLDEQKLLKLHKHFSDRRLSAWKSCLDMTGNTSGPSAEKRKRFMEPFAPRS